MRPGDRQGRRAQAEPGMRPRLRRAAPQLEESGPLSGETRRGVARSIFFNPREVFVELLVKRSVESGQLGRAHGPATSSES